MEYLKYFITEDIYPVADNRQKADVKANLAQEPQVEVKSYPLAIICSDLENKEKELLKAILNAIKLNIDDVQFSKIPSETNSKRILLFDSENDQQPFYQLITAGEKTHLYSHNLKELNAEVDKKKKLWVALQQMFSL